MSLPDLAGVVTGVGSVPGTEPAEAVACVEGWAPALPFWPQLPSLGRREGMIGQVLEGLDGVELDDDGRYAISDRRALLWDLDTGADLRFPSAASGFDAFARALQAGRFPDARAVKGQVTGPLTLASQLIRLAPDAPARLPFELSDIVYALAGRVGQIAYWQTERLRCTGLPVLIVVDEPCMDFADFDLGAEALEKVFRAIRHVGATAGLHTCAKPIPQRILDAGPDLLSFDAHRFLGELLNDPLGEQVLTGIPHIAWGLVPTTGDLPIAEAVVRGWQALLGPLASTLAPRSLVTATCGHGLQPLESAHAAFRLAADVGQRIAALA